MRMFFAAAGCILFLAVTEPAWAGSGTGKVDKNPGHLKIVLINMRCLYSAGDNAEQNKDTIKKNLKRHLYFIDKAAAQGAEFVGFPEVSINGYQFNENMVWLRLDGPEVGVLAKEAKKRGIYIGAGVAEVDTKGRKWNTQFVIGPDGKIVGWHHKSWLTAERKYVQTGTDHNVFEVKGMKMGILICADGTNYFNLKKLVDNGAEIIYGPHANYVGGTIAGWYRFRSKWAGKWDGQMVQDKKTKREMPASGWINQLKIYAAIHNHAAHYNPEYDPPTGGPSMNWASGAWFIGPDGNTLAQMPTSGNKTDSKEFMLTCNIPLPKSALARIKPEPKPKPKPKPKPIVQTKPITEESRRKSKLALAKSWEINERLDKAAKVYKEIIEEYPDTPEAKTAASRLAAILPENE